MQLTSLQLDFEITKTIPHAKRRHVGPREECSQAHESSYIKWTNSRIERVCGDVRGAATELIL
jgi:hypothetical protein